MYTRKEVNAKHYQRLKQSGLCVRCRQNTPSAGKTVCTQFTILCFNCNCGRYRNGGRCPHERSQ